MVEALNSKPTTISSLPKTADATRNNIRLIAHGSPSIRPVRFAHPAEVAIADLLDFHGVHWLYEPTTFPLVTSIDGLPLQSFTPDFYLPECDTYIEMTTMRQSLVTRKNRKFRMLRELFPQLNVRLLYRRDVELIVQHYGAPAGSDLVAGPVLVTEETIQRRVNDLAAMLVERAGKRKITLVGVGSSSRLFHEQLGNAIDACATRSPKLTLMLPDQRKRTKATPIQFGLSATIDPNSHIVMVTDVVGTGLTAHSALTWLAERNLYSESVVALADRRSARLIDVPIVGSVVTAPSIWMIGAGIGGSPLPAIHLVETPISQ